QPSGRLPGVLDEVRVPADPGTRFGAFALDNLLMVITVEVVIYLLSIFGGRQSLNWSLLAIILVSVFIFLFNCILLPSFTGQTIGKKILGIRILREDGLPLSLGDIIKRH